MNQQRGLSKNVKKKTGPYQAKKQKYMSNDEEERVPNEHPPKRHSIGINFYQTNYFSQSIEPNKGLGKGVLGMRLNEQEEEKEEGKYGIEEENLYQDLNRKIVERRSIKRRIPTDRPNNSPGDEIDFIQDKFEGEINGIKGKAQIQNVQSLERNSGLYRIDRGGEIAHSQNYYTFSQQNSSNNQFRNVEMIGAGPSRRHELMGGFVSSNPSNQHREIEILRKELQQRDNQLLRMNNDMTKLKKENQQLKMKLQFETRNNAVLMKNLTRIRQNYFQGHNQSQQIEQIQPQRVQQNRNRVSHNISSPNGHQERRPVQQTHQRQRPQNLIFNNGHNNNQSINGNASVGSESNQSHGVVDHPPTQQVHSFQPPTRASQGLRMQQLHNLQSQMRNPGLQNQRRGQLGQRVRSSQINGEGNEEGSIYESQYNDESIFINKVNEMQIKTSRFDQQINNSGLFISGNFNEDFIPNEEPFINVRNLQENNLSNHYRMRWQLGSGFGPNPQGMMTVLNYNNRQGSMGNVLGQGNGGQFIHHVHHHHIHHMYANNSSLGLNINPRQGRLQGGRGGLGLQNNMILLGMEGDNQEPIQERVRGISQGMAPLRNIFGDCQSCVEDDNENLHVGQNVQMSEGSLGVFEEEEKHQPLPLNHQMFMQNFNNGPLMGGPNGGFSVDDGGMDEYDVADERQHLFEYVNPDNMTYEELLALQDRIGFVSKGLSLEQISAFPKMKRKEVQKYLKSQKNRNNSLNQIDFEVKNPLEESKHSKKKREGEEDCDEIQDDDEGIISKKLPLNSNSHQVLLECGVNNSSGSKSPVKARNLEGDEGENCKDEDEERKEGEVIGQPQGKKPSRQKKQINTNIKNGGRMQNKAMREEVKEEEELNENCLWEEGEPQRQHISLLENSLGNSNRLHSSMAISVSSQNMDRCAICFESMQSNEYVKVLSCLHYYHCECIEQWLMVEKKCPMCMCYLDNS